VDARRERLATLEAELEAIPAALEDRRAALGRALADGATEATIKKARMAVAELDAERDGLTAAVELVRADVEVLEAEWKALHAADLEAEADRLEEAHREAQREAARELKRLAIEFAPVFDAMLEAGHTSEEARREALRAAGADREDIYHARPKNRTPAAWFDESLIVGGVVAKAYAGLHAMHELAQHLATHGRSNSNPKPNTLEAA
jgi:hypothetical protein